jgi:hypothetical protein
MGLFSGAFFKRQPVQQTALAKAMATKQLPNGTKLPNHVSKKALERMIKRAEHMPNKAAAKSAAHEGVTARPMEQQLSRALDEKRRALWVRGTSVLRINPTTEQEQEDEQRKTERSTSIGHIHSPISDLHLTQIPEDVLHPKSKKSSNAIDPFGSLE